MEEEERAAQSAKLQELIRRGGPEDLQEANRLMKIMAGYDTRSKTDYRAKAAEEVGKIQQKARLLEERLEAFKPGDKMTEGDVYEELASALQSAHPKIQRMCEEESDDTEAVAKLLEINDSIHRTVERYKLMKKGDLDSASRIAKGTLGTSTGVGKNADNELSLIDFGGEQELNGGGSAITSNGAQQSNGLEDDLLGLSMGGSSYGQGGGISLGNASTTSGPSSLFSPSPPLMAGPSTTSTPSMPTAQQPGPPKPDYSAFSAFSGISQPASARNTPPPSIFQQQQIAPKPAQQPMSDPFAALTSPLRQSTPQFPPAPQAASSNLFDFGSPAPAPIPAVAAAAPPAASGDDDEWAFSSALPESNDSPLSNNITVSDTSVYILFHASRPSPSDPVINLSVRFSSRVPQPITELTFQVAVTKVGLQTRIHYPLFTNMTDRDILCKWSHKQDVRCNHLHNTEYHRIYA